MADDTNSEDLQNAGRDYEQRLADALGRQKEVKPVPETSYGMPLKSVYTPEDAVGQDYLRDQGFPGAYPFTRGITGVTKGPRDLAVPRERCWGNGVGREAQRAAWWPSGCWAHWIRAHTPAVTSGSKVRYHASRDCPPVP